MIGSAAIAQTSLEAVDDASRSAQDLGPEQVRTLVNEDLSVGGQPPQLDTDFRTVPDFFPTQLYRDSLPLSDSYSILGNGTCNDPTRAELLCDEF